MTDLTIAIAKGRLQAETLDLLTGAGFIFSSEALSSRRLAVDDVSGRFRLIFVKPADVPVYVEHGIADCGIVGRDVLLESDADLLQPLSVNIGACRIVVAAKDDVALRQVGMVRVATKYPRIAARHFGARGVAVDLSSYRDRWSWLPYWDLLIASLISSRPARRLRKTTSLLLR